jgi:hypothetical protein
MRRVLLFFGCSIVLYLCVVPAPPGPEPDNGAARSERIWHDRARALGEQRRMVGNQLGKLEDDAAALKDVAARAGGAIGDLLGL